MVHLPPLLWLVKVCAVSSSSKTFVPCTLTSRLRKYRRDGIPTIYRTDVRAVDIQVGQHIVRLDRSGYDTDPLRKVFSLSHLNQGSHAHYCLDTLLQGTCDSREKQVCFTSHGKTNLMKPTLCRRCRIHLEVGLTEDVDRNSCKTPLLVEGP